MALEYHTRIRATAPDIMVLRSLLLVVLFAAGALAPGTAAAHKIRPAIVTATFDGAGTYEIAVTANLEALLADIGPQHADTDDAPGAGLYKALRALPAEALRARFEAFLPKWLDGVSVEFDGRRVRPRLAAIESPPPGDLSLARLSTVRLAGDVPADARIFRWTYAAAFGPCILRVKPAGGGDLVTSWLKDGRQSEPIPLAGAAAKSSFDLFVEYVGLGFTHILPEGLDHILFVLGLYLLTTQLRPLLVQVTAFTVAHSITLALGLYGVVRISPAIVEPLIAVSIVYVAVENIVTTKLHVWRPFVVFGFGLLHGLGFAGVLQEIGLPRADFVTGLVAFNVGVEFGQLAVIALAWVATGMWFATRPWYRTRIVQPASAAIALVGLYWTVDRVLFS
ncbi:MAG: HupE/UreJ family protein [Methyloligellaceae bacterium]